MKRTLKQNLKNLKKKEYRVLRAMCRLSKNMYNVYLYEVRQHFFNNSEYLSFNKVYHRVKNNENYELLPSQVAQQTMRNVDKGFKSFFRLLEKKWSGKYERKVSPPNYLKKDGFFMIDFPNQSFQVKDTYLRIGVPKRLREEFDIKLKEIRIPFTYDYVKNKNIKRLQILPKGGNCDYFEYRIIYDIEPIESDVEKDNFLTIDLGLNNLATCVDHTGRSFILDGRRLKSINWWFNKRKARLQSIKDKQEISVPTERLNRLFHSRRDRIHDYLNKAVNYTLEYCLENKIGTIIIGDGRGWKDSISLGKKTNQSFVSIPFNTFKRKLKCKCELHGIDFNFQDESYTSKCSFFDNEEVKKHKKYKGKRVHRGLFKTEDGNLVNADVNGALNIAVKFNKRTKSKLKGLSPKSLLSTVDVPSRIREPFEMVNI
ncbi:MAG: RNA-guided endonuclease InsQ/TnpB family protein [Elusimicrobiota bacterium]